MENKRFMEKSLNVKNWLKVVNVIISNGTQLVPRSGFPQRLENLENGLGKAINFVISHEFDFVP